MSEKEEKEDKKEKKKNPDQEFVQEIIDAISKRKAGPAKNSKLIYKKTRFAPKKNVSHGAFKNRVLELRNDGKTSEEIAKLLEDQAVQLNVVERKIPQKEKDPEPTEEEKQQLEKFKKDAEEKIAEEQKAFIEKRAKGQKGVRQRAKERSMDEVETQLKQTEERVRKEEREIADKKIEALMKELEQSKVERVEPKISEKKVSKTIKTVLDSAPSVARMLGSALAPSGMGSEVGKLAQSVVSIGVPMLTNLFVADESANKVSDVPPAEPSSTNKEKEEKDSKEEVIEIKATGFTPQAIPPGLKRFMRNIGTYTSIYNRLSPEQKQSISPIDQGMLVLKQALTRTPVTTAAAKTYHSMVGKILDKMNREMKTPEDIKNNIEELGAVLSDPPEEIRNVIGPIDNALGVGYGQVIEMKRTGNVLQPLVETAGNQILRLEPQQIAEAFNSIMRNATEAELGGQERVEPRERKIPQVGLEQARQLKEIVKTDRPNSSPDEVEEKKTLGFTPETPEFIRQDILQPEARSLFLPGGMRLPPLRPISSNQGFLSPEENTLLADESATKRQDAKFELSERKRARDRKREENTLLADESATKRQQPYEGVATDPSGIASDIKKTIGVVTGAAAGVPGLVYDTAKNIYNNIMETPITMPVETQAQSDQKISSATGTMRPRFIVPGRDSVIPSMPKIRADDIQFSAFDYVIPGSEGGNGTARSNPLVLSQELEERLRYSNAGITISPGFGENVVNMILTESELKALLLPRGPDVSPVIYEFPIIDGDQAQNEVKRYDQNLIQVEKFSPYNEYNDNEQLDEEVFGSILLSYVP
jgi:hypothetical protein